jgi:hypothetical protein
MKRMSRLLAARPWSTNAAIGGVCSIFGDMITQHQTPAKISPDGDSTQKGEFDVRRNLAYGAFGAVWSAPALLLYKTLERKLPLHTLVGAVKGAAIGQVVLDLPLSVPAFLILTDFIRGRDAAQMTEHFKNDYTDCAMTSFSLWFPLTIFNLRIVPMHYRVVFDSCVMVVWTSLFSYVSNRRALAAKKGST